MDETAALTLLQTWLAILAHDFMRYFLTASAFFMVFGVWKRKAWSHLRNQSPDGSRCGSSIATR
jgi:hypothetical protein